MRFTEYLINEVEMNLSFDPSKESPQDIVTKAKQASRVGVANPQRAIKMRQQNIKDKMKNIQASDDPLEADRIAIKKLEEKIARMKMVLARKEKALQSGQTVTSPGVV